MHTDVYTTLALDPQSQKSDAGIHNPRLAFGENSDWNTGTVELMTPMPHPDTILATIMCARAYAVACSRAPRIIMQTQGRLSAAGLAFRQKMMSQLRRGMLPLEYLSTALLLRVGVQVGHSPS